MADAGHDHRVDQMGAENDHGREAAVVPTRLVLDDRDATDRVVEDVDEREAWRAAEVARTRGPEPAGRL